MRMLTEALDLGVDIYLDRHNNQLRSVVPVPTFQSYTKTLEGPKKKLSV